MIFGTEPFGVVPYGSIDSSLDLSIPDPFSGLVADYLSQKSVLVLASPLRPSDNIRQQITLGDGYASLPDDSLPDGTSLPNALFRAGLISSYSYSVRVMQGGVIASSPEPSRGDIRIENTTGRLDSIKAYLWDGAEIQTLYGRTDQPLSEFTEVFRGVTGEISEVTSELTTIPTRDLAHTLKRSIVTDRYMGLGAALRGNGVSGYADAALPCPPGSVTVEIYLRPVSNAASLKSLAGWRNGASGAGARELRFSATGGANNQPEISITNDAGIRYTLTATALEPTMLPAGSLYYVAFVLDSAAQTLTLVTGLSQSSLQVDTLAVAGSYTTSLTNFTLMRLPDGASQFADVDIAEVRVWPTAQSLQYLKDNKSRPVDVAAIASMSAYYPLTEGIGTTLFDSAPVPHNATTHGTVTWVGSLEGDASLVGQTPPLWEGIKRQVEPVSVDAQNHVYEVSRSAVTVTDVADKGSTSGITIDAPTTDIYATTPAAGHCTVAVMGGRTLIRLAGAPLGLLTVTVTGDTLDTAGIVQKIAQTYMGLSLDEIDIAAFAEFSLRFPSPVGIALHTDNAKAWDIMSDLAYKSGGWVIPTRRNKLTIAILEEPLTAKYTITEDDIEAGTLTEIVRTVAAKRTTLSYRPYQRTQDPGNLATGLDEATKADLGKETRSLSTPVDEAVIAARAHAEDLIQDTYFDDPADTYTEALRRQSIWGVDRVTYSFRLVRGMFKYAIGDDVALSIYDSMRGTYLEGLNGSVFKIVAISEDYDSQQVVLECWGARQYNQYLATDDGLILVADDGTPFVIDG